MRLLLLFSSLLLLAASLLNALKAPTLTAWKLSILTMEWGHLFAVAALGSLVFGLREVWLGRANLCSAISITAAAAAFVLFCRPSWTAARLASSLPSRLSEVYGDFAPARPPFRLWPFSSTTGSPLSESSHVYGRDPAGNSLSLTLISPAKGLTPRPCLVVIHGGGWDGGDRSELMSFSRRLAQLGCTVASVDYSLAPKHVWPAQRDDLFRALDFIAAHALEWSIDPTRLVLLGRSAGGQLAEAVAYAPRARNIRGVIALYAPADLPFAWSRTPERDVLDSKLLMRQFLGGSPEEKPDSFRDASPYLSADSASVPTLLIHGRLDPLVWHRQSERLAFKLASNRADSFFLDLPCSTHGFDYNPDGPSAQLSLYSIEWFLRAVTQPPEA